LEYIWGISYRGPTVRRRRTRRGDQRIYGGIMYKQILINVKLQNGMRGQNTELSRKSPLRRRRSILDLSAIVEVEVVVVVVVVVVEEE
jgi:hypothetical protein